MSSSRGVLPAAMLMCSGKGPQGLGAGSPCPVDFSGPRRGPSVVHDVAADAGLHEGHPLRGHTLVVEGGRGVPAGSAASSLMLTSGEAMTLPGS